MHQPSLSKYASYIKEKADVELIELEHGFVTYSFGEDVAHINDMWVSPEYRRSGLGAELASMVISEAKKRGIGLLSSNLQLNTNDFNKTLITQLCYGFKVIGANEKEIKLVKEI